MWGGSEAVRLTFFFFFFGPFFFGLLDIFNVLAPAGMGFVGR